MAVRIVLAEDHGITRQGLRSLLENAPDMEVVGEAADGREAIDLVRRERPDVFITDVSMPNLNGADATRRILQDLPQVKVIGLSMHSTGALVADMLKAGASGYVLKESLFGELLDAIHTVLAGGTYLSGKVAGIVVEDYVSRLSTGPNSPLDKLTVREREVLQLITEGQTTKQIALALHVSAKAIEANRRRIMDKLDAHSVAELVKVAIASGLTSV